MNEDSRKRKWGKLNTDMIPEDPVPISELVSFMNRGPRSENFNWSKISKSHGVKARKMQQLYADALLIRLRFFVEHVFNHMPPPESEGERKKRLALAEMVARLLECKCIRDTCADVNARCVIFLLCFMFYGPCHLH